MTRFTAINTHVFYLDAYLEPRQVEQLIRIFEREKAWDLFDELVAARDEAGYLVTEIAA